MTNKATIGAILKNRIKQMNYTQENFAGEVGIGFSTLKKYFSGENTYSYEMLMLFAEKLECSYDYLLGYTISTSRDVQDMKDSTRLSDEAIRNIKELAKLYDTEKNNKHYIDTLSRMIETDMLIETIGTYIQPKDEELVTMLSTVKSMVEQVGIKFSDSTWETATNYTLFQKLAECKDYNFSYLNEANKGVSP